MSFSKSAEFYPPSQGVAEFQYRQMNPIVMPAPRVKVEPREPEVRLTEDALRKRLAAERAEGAAEAEGKLRQEYEERLNMENGRITSTIREFAETRKSYFIRVEVEVVQLALAIAAKILHREAQVDPLLLAAVVQIALGQLKDGSVASIRVRPEDAPRWIAHIDSLALKLSVSVIEDHALEPGDCVLDTDLRAVNFSLDVQLKEVEQGFFDVLAQKPQL